MWLSETDREPLQTPDGADTPVSNAGRDSALERYRMYGRFYERYWSTLFGMTHADMTRFAAQMRESGKAMTLTDLSRDLIRARLQAGSQPSSGPAPNGGAPSRSVRRWDPGASWREGDQAIVAVASPSRGRAIAPRVCKVVHVEDDRVVLNIDGIAAPQVFGLGPAVHTQEDEEAEAEMLNIGQRTDEDAQIDFVLWRYGPRIVGCLLHALEADRRFVELEGLWFPRELAVRPSDSMLVRLAERMFEQNVGAVRLGDVVAVLSPGGSAQAATRLGLAQALGERTDLFEDVGSAAHPRWTLAGSPPPVLTARHAVYDPETYVVLCEPGETLSSETTRQLWRAGLLGAAMRGTPDQVVDATSSGEPGSDLPAAETEFDLAKNGSVIAAPPDDTAGRRWQRWRAFSRGAQRTSKRKSSLHTKRRPSRR